MLKSIELSGFKSFGRKSTLEFTSPIAAIVGPNGSGKSNVAEAFRFVLGEQSMKSLRSKKGEDLIWGGSQGLSRQSRASVKVTFDNSSGALSVDFPEVIIERVVYRDGVNEYSINGSKVRLRDVSALLSQANIGSSGYHIISQGEADRVLSASARERREMVEEALGLKAFQNKKQDSEKKLEETDQNLREVGLLRRELAPHLKYLEKQVEKIEKAKELQEELAMKLTDYLSRERAYISARRATLEDKREELKHRSQELEQKIKETKAALEVQRMDANSDSNPETEKAEQALASARAEREEVSRELGRAEGELSALRASGANSHSSGEAVAASAVHAFTDSVAGKIEDALKSNDMEQVHLVLSEIKDSLAAFRLEIGQKEARSGEGDVARDVANRVEKLTNRFEEVQRKEMGAERALADARRKEKEGREEAYAQERALIEESGELREVQANLSRAEESLQELDRLKTRFDDEVREGVLLVGSNSLSFQGEAVPDGVLSEDRGVQEGRRREVERIKIKIEEYRGAGSEEVEKEFAETKERDQFLARESEDLERSASHLRTIIEELDASIEERFSAGLSQIQKEFNTFFVQLFGGGSATLTLEKMRAAEGDDTEQPSGIGISVQLPRKQVRGLEVLSGGERALTSIALIFAMSQVNPPPFLILDETDAALDEANSRRYAQIVEMLGKRSQLILITHNRATMAAAGELYGVTMGQDGVSKLLSVKLEEAEAVAK